MALANEPALLLADEPTSHLDAESASAVIELIRTASAERGTTVVVVTHDATVGTALERTLTIRDGRIGGAGFAGQDYLVVDRGGTVQLPAEFYDVLPPGSLARAVRTADGVELRPVGPDGGAPRSATPPATPSPTPSAPTPSATDSSMLFAPPPPAATSPPSVTGEIEWYTDEGKGP